MYKTASQTIQLSYTTQTTLIKHTVYKVCFQITKSTLSSHFHCVHTTFRTRNLWYLQRYTTIYQFSKESCMYTNVYCIHWNDHMINMFCVCACVCVCVYVCFSVYTYVYTHTHVHAHVYTSTDTHTYIHTHARIHTHAHMHTHTHTHTHAHTHTHPHTPLQNMVMNYCIIFFNYCSPLNLVSQLVVQVWPFKEWQD